MNYKEKTFKEKINEIYLKKIDNLINHFFSNKDNNNYNNDIINNINDISNSDNINNNENPSLENTRFLESSYLSASKSIKSNLSVNEKKEIKEKTNINDINSIHNSESNENPNIQIDNQNFFNTILSKRKDNQNYLTLLIKYNNQISHIVKIYLKCLLKNFVMDAKLTSPNLCFIKGEIKELIIKNKLSKIFDTYIEKVIKDEIKSHVELFTEFYDKSYLDEIIE
jgi:hypothetical protein